MANIDVTINPIVTTLEVTIVDSGNTYVVKPVVTNNIDGGGTLLHSGLTLDDGTNPHGTTKADVGLSNVPNTDFTSDVSANTSKISFDTTSSTRLSGTSGTNTGDQDLSVLALKSNVLELDNTTSFTPDSDYEPATKKYVDDNSGGNKTIETTLPSSIPIDGTTIYHIENGVIKPSLNGNIEGENVEIISNPNDGDSLDIDLSEYPFIQLQGGGFTESPANYYTLETDLANGLLKQHLTLMLWRRNNLFISNSLNYIPEIEITFLSVINNSNSYLEVSFNKIIKASDLVIGNFSETFTQGGGTATGVTLDSVTDSSGAAISGNEKNIRIYFTITGISNGLESFTVTSTSLTDIYENNNINVVSSSVVLINQGTGDVIADLPNTIAYWKESEGDNETGIATKTDIKNSKVLSASGESNPTLSGTEWVFNGTNQGFRLIDAPINALINADAKDFQIHYVGNFKAVNTRIVVGTDVGVSPNSLWNFIYRSVADSALSIFDAAGDTITEIVTTSAVGTNYLFSLKFYQDSGNKVDVYIDNGTVITSFLSIDASTINISNVEELFIGMRETTSKSFYNIGFKSMVIANSSANFDTIRTELAL